MRMLDPDHPFFRPIWRRWATCLVPLLWAAFEFWGGNPGWAMLFAAAGLYAGWVLIVTGPGSG